MSAAIVSDGDSVGALPATYDADGSMRVQVQLEEDRLDAPIE